MTFRRINPALCLLVLLFQSRLSFSQDIIQAKFSPILRNKPAAYFEDSVRERKYVVCVGDVKSSIAILRQRNKEFKNIQSLSDELLLVSTTPKKIYSTVQHLPHIIFIDEQPVAPVEEEGVSSHDLSMNAIYAAHHYFPGLDGKNQVVSVKENRMNPEDVDLLGRYLPSTAESSTGSTHATIMTTLIAGAGNSFYKGKGVAPESSYASADFATALPDTVTYYQQLNVATQNHSYGVGIQNYYGAHARAFDLSVNKLKRLTHVFSAGNSGNLSPLLGDYAGIPGYANLTGNMKMAKNILLVGAIDSFGVVPELSSRGPAYDGRIKPELVAFAEDGTSGSAALVSGASLILQQQFRETFGDYASSDLVRAILINSADDIGIAGPDFVSGFGKLNLYRGLTTLKNSQFFQSELISNAHRDFVLSIPANIRHLKISLCWNDTAASPNTAKALINDLDLELIHIGSGQIWLPWGLNTYPNADSLKQPAIRKRDSLNNNEQITLDDPLPGDYIIRVRSSNNQTSSQTFSVAYQMDTLNGFTWIYPTGSDAIIAGKQQFVRWLSSFSTGATGSLEITKNGGQSWKVINPNVLLSDHQFAFSFPDTITTGRFRMKTGTRSFLSDSFPIAPVLDLRVGFVCDSVLLYWNKPFDHNLFRLYRIQDDSLQLVTQTGLDNYFTDVSVYTRYAITPFVSNQEGQKSYTIDYTRQGVGCYINNFLTDLININQGELKLQLGTLYLVKKVSFQKLSNTVQTIFQQIPTTQTNFIYVDAALQQGLNIYRAVVELEDGSLIHSEPETVFYSNNKPNIIFPNPVPQGMPLQVLVEQPGAATAHIYDAQGKLTKKVSLEEKLNEISTRGLAKGLYFMRVFEVGKQSTIYHFVIQ